MAKQGARPSTLEIREVFDSIAAGRLLMRRAQSEMTAAIVIARLELPRYHSVIRQCRATSRPRILQAYAEYFSMVAVAAAIVGRHAEAKELAALATRLPWPADENNRYFSRRRRELF